MTTSDDENTVRLPISGMYHSEIQTQRLREKKKDILRDLKGTAMASVTLRQKYISPVCP